MVIGLRERVGNCANVVIRVVGLVLVQELESDDGGKLGVPFWIPSQVKRGALQGRKVPEYSGLVLQGLRGCDSDGTA